MKNKPEHFRVRPKHKIRLKKLPTKIPDFYKSDEDYEQRLAAHKVELRRLQQLLYAHGRLSLLIVFQAMDAGGKDSAIEHVMSGVNPQGCQVYSFKQPSAQELAHDFLWRTTRCLPERGHIGIFNRSYYEEVVVVRVHPELLKAEPLPERLIKDDDIWNERYESIRDLEKHLYRNGTHIIKFFLNVSKSEQKQRFLDRLEEPDKYWKFSSADIDERKLWDDYMSAYEHCLEATSTKHSPWYIIPADDKKNARLIMSTIINDALGRLDMHYPEISAAKKREFAQIREKLEA